MKIQPKTGTKKPLYALGASLLIGATLMSGCHGGGIVEYGGETETTSYPSSETSLETIASDASSAYLSIALDMRTFTPEEALAWAKEQNIPVFEDSVCTSGKETWQAFCDMAYAKQGTEILCAYYYSAQCDAESQLHFYLIRCDSTYFRIDSRDCTEEYPEFEARFNYLMHFVHQNPEGSKYDYYEYYVLTDDDTLRFDDLFKNNDKEYRIVYKDAYNSEETAESTDETTEVLAEDALEEAQEE